MISGAQSIGQRPIIALMQELGYRSNEAGVCAGIAMMFVVAITSRNLSMFNEMINLINKEPHLSAKIRQLKQVIANYKVQHPNDSYCLSHDEQVLMNVLAFFDGIELFQQPVFYSEWFGKALTLYENEQISGFVFPQKAMAANGLRKIDCWSGIYDQSELKYFLKSLEEAVRTKKHQVSFAISLDNSIHEISLAYDSVSDTWQLCDANHLPPMIFKHADTGELHDILFKAMIENRGEERGKQIAFVSTIYAASADELVMLELMQNLRMSPCFELAHMLSHKKVKAITNNGLTLLHLAAYSGHRDMVNFLISANCDVNSPLVTGFTPLHLAVFNGNDVIVKNLIDAGADYNIKTKKGLTPLDIAAEFGYEKVVRTLIDAGAQVNTITPDGDTAAHLAAEFGYDVILGMMIQAGADVQRLNKSGFSVTHIAALFGFVNEMSFIIKTGANLDHVNLEGMTPLHLAVLNNHVEMVKMLLGAGANCNIANKKGITPLFAAAREGHKEIAQVLLEYGADYAKAYTCSAQCLLADAAQNHKEDNMRLLLNKKIKHGSSSDRISITPFEMSAAMGHVELAKMLADKAARQNFRFFSDANSKNKNDNYSRFLNTQPQALKVAHPWPRR